MAKIATPKKNYLPPHVISFALSVDFLDGALLFDKPLLAAGLDVEEAFFPNPKSIFNEETCFLPFVGMENAAICAIKIKAMQIVKYCMFLITNWSIEIKRAKYNYDSREGVMT